MTGTLDIGPWRVLRQLSSSGLCVVYEVEKGRGERAALKRYVGLALLDEETRRRFAREIRLGLSVVHPHVCRALDWGLTDDGSPYLVMELLEGKTLRQRLDDSGALPVDQATAIARQLLAGAGAIHDHGLVHRDLKPENIFLQHGEDVRILDFGLTSKYGGGSLTPTGISMGTVGYAAPEQVFNARHVDTRADLFTIGVVFFEMLTGHRPFEGGSVAETLSLLTGGDPPSLSSFQPSLAGTAVERLVDSLLSRLPEQRPESAAAALAML
ncbi:MAG TPA: serine/threonine-protein kinase [Candidatus Xenobia bacterium]